MTTQPNSPVRRFPSLAAPWPVLLVAGLMVAALLAVSAAYGFHRDELYFIVAGRHPALGYPDQPPLTPLLSVASVALLGLSPTAVRVLPALAMGLTVVLTALMARDLGGSRRAQLLAALTVALSGYLAAGHFDATATYDLLFAAVILWLLLKLLAGADRRLWLAVGAAAGIGLENKDTLLLLCAGLLVGLALARRWDVARSPWAWAAAGIALLIWAPNLAWQATHGWPQLTMAHVIAGDAAANRAQLLPVLWLFTGPLLFALTLAGWAWMLRAKAAAPWRTIAFAAVGRARARGGQRRQGLLRSRRRTALHGGGRPPPRPLAGPRPQAPAGRELHRGGGALGRARRVPDPADPAGGDFRDHVAALLDTDLSRADRLAATRRAGGAGGRGAAGRAARPRAVILTNNYGEAAALDLLGKGLPPVYSGHNGFWYWGPPPTGRTVVVHVGDWTRADWSPYFTGCRTVAHIDNGLGIENQEQGQAISVCSGVREPWTAIWPRLRHLS